MKTSTTFLQQQLFPSLSDTALFSYGSGFVEMMGAIRNAPPFAAHDADLERLRGWIAQATESRVLFSWEGLVGHYLSNHRDFATVTAFLHRAAPQARILLVLRRQSDLLESLYKQSLHTGHFNSPAGFLNDDGCDFGGHIPLAQANIDIRTLDFDRFVQGYEALFGAANVDVVPFEWLGRDPDRFYRMLGASLGCAIVPPGGARPANVGYSKPTAAIARRVNRLYRTPHNPGGLLPYRPFGGAARGWRRGLNAMLDPRNLLQGPVNRLFPPREPLFDSSLRARIMAAHAASNRALDHRRGLGLDMLGYY